MSRARQWLLGRQYQYDYMEHFQSIWRSGLYSRPAITESLRILPPGVINSTWNPVDVSVAMQHSLFPEDHWYRRLVKERLPILQYETMSPTVNEYKMRSTATLAQRMAYDWYKNIHQKKLSEDDAFAKTLESHRTELEKLLKKVTPYIGDATAELALKMPFTQSLLCRVHARKVEVAAADYASNVNSLLALGQRLKYQGWPIRGLTIEEVIMDATASQTDHLLFWLRAAAFDHPVTQSFVKEVDVRVAANQSPSGEEMIIKMKVYPCWYKGIESFLTDKMRQRYKIYRMAARKKLGLPDLPNSSEEEYDKAEYEELFNRAETDEIFDSSDILLCRHRGGEPPFTAALLESHRILRHLLLEELRLKHSNAINQHMMNKLLKAGRYRRRGDDDDGKRSGMAAVARGKLPIEFAKLNRKTQMYLLDYYEFANTPMENQLKKVKATPFMKQRGYTDHGDYLEWMKESAAIDREQISGVKREKKQENRFNENDMNYYRRYYDDDDDDDDEDFEEDDKTKTKK